MWVDSGGTKTHEPFFRVPISFRCGEFSAENFLDADPYNFTSAGMVTAKWTMEQKTFLVSCIMKKQIAGVLSSGMKKSDWNDVLKDFNALAKVDYDKKQLESQYYSLREQFVAIKGLRNRYGIGWDPFHHRVTAPDSCWDELEKVKPALLHYKTTEFPWYDDIGSMVDGTPATGSYSRQFTAAVEKEKEIEEEKEIVSEKEDLEEVEEAELMPEELLDTTISSIPETETRKVNAPCRQTNL